LLLLEIGVLLGAHHHDLELLVIIHAGDHVGRLQHVLVEEIADGEIVGIIADRHHRDDLLGVQVEGQRPLHRHRRLDDLAAFVDARHALGEAGIGGVRDDEGRRVGHGTGGRGNGAGP